MQHNILSNPQMSGDARSKGLVNALHPDFPAIFRAIAHAVDQITPTVVEQWVLEGARHAGCNSYLARLIEQTAASGRPKWTLYATLHRLMGGAPRIPCGGDLLVGFARLRTVTSDSVVRLDIGGHQSAGVCLGHQAGSFVYAHLGRFVVPMLNLSLQTVRLTVCPMPKHVECDTDCVDCVEHIDDAHIGVVWGCLGAAERRALCSVGAWSMCPVPDGGAHVRGRGHLVITKFMNGVASMTPDCAPDSPDMIELPDMIEVAMTNAADGSTSASSAS